MDCGNLVVLLIFISMEDQMLCNSGLQSQNLWLCSQFPETLGRSGHLPSLDPFLHLEKVLASTDILLFYKKQGPLVSFLYLSDGEEKLQVSCLQ